MKRSALMVVACTAAVASAAPDPQLGRDVAALARRRWQELLAMAPKDPSQLRAIGPCVRPDAAALAALQKRLASWIAKRLPGWRPLDDTTPLSEQLRPWVGCEDPRGLVVDVQVDVARGDRRVGHWWVLRVRPKAIDVVAEQEGEAADDFMEWADERSVGTFAILDLDGDGVTELLIDRSRREGGAIGGDVTISLATARGLQLVGHHDGPFDVATVQPPPDQHTIVVRAGDDSGRAWVYRCIDAPGPWHPCAAAAAAREYDDALAAAGELDSGTNDPPDADLLERRLRAMGVPADQRAALVARAQPAPLYQITGRASEDRDRARQTLTADELAVETAAEEATLAAEIRAATGDPPCPAATAKATRAAAAAIRGWMSAPELERLRALGSCPATGRCAEAVAVTPAITASCVGPRGAYWLARWQHDSRTNPLERYALFVTRGRGAPALVIDTSVRFDSSSEAWPPADGVIDAKFSLVGGSIVASVRTPAAIDATMEPDAWPRGDQIVAVVDGTVRGAPIKGAIRWSWMGAHGDVAMHADSLVVVIDADAARYLHATPAGLVPLLTLSSKPALTAPPVAHDPVGLLLEPLARRAWARDLARYVDDRKLADPAYRAEVLAALRLDGADPALIDRVAHAAP